jgi:uncharacterized repeat protein (TIGR03803 family)
MALGLTATGEKIVYEFANPLRNSSSRLVAYNGFLYGTAPKGGALGCGGIFRTDPVSGVTSAVASFDCAENGATPKAGLVLHGDVLYGTTTAGALGAGTVFRFDPATTVLTTIKKFSPPATPRGVLAVKDDFLYGVTADNTQAGHGVVFKISLVDETFAVLATLTEGISADVPEGGLVALGAYLYGTTEYQIFKVDPADGQFTTLLQFASDDPLNGGLSVSGGLLFGTTRSGGGAWGSGSFGTVFSVNPDTAEKSVLVTFHGPNGYFPLGGVLPLGGFLYGTTRYGGTDTPLGFGSVFKIDLGTEAFETIGTFTDTNGSYPSCRLIFNGNRLYGTTPEGGAGGVGTVFSLDLGSGSLETLWSANGEGLPFGPVDELVANGSTLLGLTTEGGAYGKGALFEFDPVSQTLVVRASFGGPTGGGPHGLLHLGPYFYGATSALLSGNGTIFKFDPATNSSATVSTLANVGNTVTAGLVTDGSYLYGSTSSGTTTGYGAAFRTSLTDGSTTVLASFDGTNVRVPSGAMTLVGTFLYGSSLFGGVNNGGKIFKIDTATGEVFTVHSFVNSEGVQPNGGLLLSGNYLFGTTQSASGSSGSGIPISGGVFKIDVTTSSFTRVAGWDSHTLGEKPNGNLLEREGWLYGTTRHGGVNIGTPNGTVFKVNSTTGESVSLLAFDGTNGSEPLAGLTAAGSLLYGTTTRGGSANGGVIFALDPDTPPFGAPANLVAAGDQSVVHVSWSEVNGATSGYEITRTGASEATFYVNGTTFDDATVSPNSAYVYKVRARRAAGVSPYSGSDYASTSSYTDDPIQPGITTIRAEHFTQLRSAVNQIRAAVGLTAASFTDASLAGQRINAVHVEELRTALNAARAEIGLPPLSFTNSPIVPASSRIFSVDLSELRNGTR